MKLYLDALAQAYDPHSEYLSKADMKNFSINMGLSLVGIGAMLRSEDGYAKIESLVVGGPAQTDGRLKVGDRISAVAQGRRNTSMFARCDSTKSSK
jgi:Periplasmic protease